MIHILITLFMGLLCRLFRVLGHEVVFYIHPVGSLEALEDKMDSWIEEHRMVPYDLDKEYSTKEEGPVRWIKREE